MTVVSLLQSPSDFYKETLIIKASEEELCKLLSAIQDYNVNNDYQVNFMGHLEDEIRVALHECAEFNEIRAANE